MPWRQERLLTRTLFLDLPLLEEACLEPDDGSPPSSCSEESSSWWTCLHSGREEEGKEKEQQQKKTKRSLAGRVRGSTVGGAEKEREKERCTA